MTWVVTFVAALATAISTIVALVFVVLPDRPPKQGASLSGLALDANVPFSRYIDRGLEPGAQPSDFRRRQLATRGVIVTYNLRIVGYRGTDLILDWQMVDVKTGERLDGSRANTIQPKVDDDQATKHMFVVLPRQEGPFRLEFQLILPREPSPLLLADLQSEPFGGRS